MKTSGLSPEDAAAIAAFKAGEREAFEPLFLRYRDRIHAQAYRMLKDQGLALDVVQEAFLALLRKLPAWEAQAPLGAWLSETAWRLAQTQRRRRLPGTALEAAESGPVPSALEQEEESRRLWETVGDLSSRDREAILLRYAQDLSVQEVASEMGITSKAVISHLSRAMAGLRDRIRERP